MTTSGPEGRGARKRRTSTHGDQGVGQQFARTFAPPGLYDKERRKEWRLEEEPGRRGPYIVELNLQHTEGLLGAVATLKELHAQVIRNAPEPTPISRTYYLCRMSWAECKKLLKQDEQHALAKAGQTEGNPMRFRAIYKLWPDFPVRSQVYRSLPTIKANAARRSFEAEGEGIVWAVIDSGIRGSHAHFQKYRTVDAEGVRNLHRSFVEEAVELDGVPLEPRPALDPDDPTIDKDERTRRVDAHRTAALADEFGHGTHVAGIIAGCAPLDRTEYGVRLFERVDRPGTRGQLERTSAIVEQFNDLEHLHGVAPQCRLVSLKVLDEFGEGRSSDVIRALEYIRENLNDNPKLLRVHGVNLSVGYEFDAEMFACGQSPICAEVDRLVQSGVVVVAAAGNTGYGSVGSSTRETRVGLSNTINDPGNAEQAITVGATHRDAPYMYGVSYFSSKGPTGDGRLKPDLVAPGERITSCGAGTRLNDAIRAANASAASASEGVVFADYMEDSGTSMAAPHVSGAIAAFLSIRREFIGKPVDVKRIFTSTASPLGRERYFEGHGLLDLVRAIQSV
ncbi:S8 family peptidase [Nocardia sp. NPDC127606]|uniref:S8 family peptidase n=1 Tax=Nocardia sp. NPDC127606 TaxID=3345406 RepID=UPI003628FB75